MGLEEALHMVLRRQQLLIERKTATETMPGDLLKAEMLRALLYDLEQANRALRSGGMMDLPGSLDVPTFDEWVMLIDQDAAQARRQLIALKARNKQQGLLADPSLELSIESYDRAQRLCAEAASDPAQAARKAMRARLGRATLGPHPDRDDWVALIARDPDFARELYGALRAKEAMFGSQTPQAILMSIAAYDAAAGDNSTV